MTIARILESRNGEIVRCSASTPVRDAVALLSQRRIGALPVMDGDRIVGIFSERDVIRCLAEQGAEALGRPVSEVMTAPPVTVTRQTPVLEALGMMTRRRFRHLPVMEGDDLIGFVSIGDLVKHRIDHVQSEAEALRSYIQSA